MQTVSSTYVQLMENGAQQEIKIVIGNNTYTMDDLVELRTYNAMFDRSLSVGNTMAGTIDVRLVAQSSDIPTMAQMQPFVRLTDGESTSEWISRGIYWVDTREYARETGILTLHGFDAMLKGEQDYLTYGDQGTWPQIDINILCDIAYRLDLGTDSFTLVTNASGNPKAQGWYYSPSAGSYYLTSDTNVITGKNYYTRTNSGIDDRTIPLIANHYEIGYPGIGEGAYTIRDILGYIGSAYAGNWIINETGQLRLIVVGDIPAETNYFIDENDNRITLGGDRLVFV